MIFPLFPRSRRYGRPARHLALALVCLALSGGGLPQNQGEPVRRDSGGPLLPEQAAYDVTFYDLTLRVDPSEKSIEGAVLVHARIVHPTSWFVLDLDPLLTARSVSAIQSGNYEQSLRYERRDGRIWAAFPLMKQPGERVQVRVVYGGKPRVAPNPPWNGGFTWAKTPSGAPWIGVSCQMQGADLWWPCKDHPSDEADGMALHITVPEPLICAANGRLMKTQQNQDGTRTFHWRVSTPINNYGVSLNIAPYRTITGVYRSVDGRKVPDTFWVLPEHYEQGRDLFRQFLTYARFLEERLGPYPFRQDKLGIAETPYLGMEHQTIIAYGSDFKNNEHGFDWLLFHEFAHEWWANLVTNADWGDMWLHEGFATYMEALLAEHLKGEAAYHRYLAGQRFGIRNARPVAPRGTTSAAQIYGSDIYGKGALILHTLRYLIGDKAFQKALRRMAYPDPAAEQIVNGKQCRFATTDDFLHIAEAESGQRLDWFFEVYLRQPKLPRLISEVKNGELHLRWETPNGLPFPMPVEVRLGGSTRRVEMPQGMATVPLNGEENPVVDPTKWVLKAE